MCCSESESEWSNDDDDYITGDAFPDSACDTESPPNRDALSNAPCAVASGLGRVPGSVPILDSGACAHVCTNPANVSDLRKSSLHGLRGVSGRVTVISGIGSTPHLDDVMLVPDSRHQLVSTGALSDQTGCSVRFSDSNAHLVLPDGHMLHIANRSSDGLYRVTDPRLCFDAEEDLPQLPRVVPIASAPTVGKLISFQLASPCVCTRVQRQVTPNLEMPPPLRNRSRVCEAVDCLSRMYARKRQEDRHAQGGHHKGHLVWRTRVLGQFRPCSHPLHNIWMPLSLPSRR